MNVVRSIRKWKIQDGGRQTGSFNNSACRQDSNEIPAATPAHVFEVTLFSRANANIAKYTVQPQIQYGGRKTAVLTSQAVYGIESKFQRLYNHVFRHSRHKRM